MRLSAGRWSAQEGRGSRIWPSGHLPGDLDLQEMTDRQAWQSSHGREGWVHRHERSGVMTGDVITHVDGQPVYDKDGLTV